MLGQKSLEIGHRLAETLLLIESGNNSTPLPAEPVDVSIPTISRIVVASRQRAHDIRAEGYPEGWRYIWVSNTQDSASLLKEVERNERIGLEEQGNRN